MPIIIIIIISLVYYIISAILVKNIFYQQSYLRFKNALIDNSEENVKRVTEEFIKEEQWLCYIPFINILVGVVLVLMLLIDNYCQ